MPEVLKQHGRLRRDNATPPALTASKVIAHPAKAAKDEKDEKEQKDEKDD